MHQVTFAATAVKTNAMLLKKCHRLEAVCVTDSSIFTDAWQLQTHPDWRTAKVPTCPHAKALLCNQPCRSASAYLQLDF
jgi:hypothetical protein